MKTIRNEEYGEVRTFVPVTEFPEDYFVWNIGREHFPYEKRIPLCRLDPDREYDWQMNVDIHNLKYIIVESEDVALNILKEAGKHDVDKKRFYEIVNS